MNPTCTTCRWYNSGQCHRHAPTVLVNDREAPGTNYVIVGEPVTVWPYVHSTAFCGEHATK